jgi:hypothetical protein
MLPFIAALSLAGVALISEFGLYQKLILPKLPEIQSVPVEWWIGMLIPLVLVGLLLGYSCGSIRSALSCASGGTVGLIAYEFVMAWLNQPGHLKSWANEDSVYFFTTHALIVFVVVLLVVLAGFGTNRLIDYRESPMT